MSRRDLSKFNASSHAASELEYVIETNKKSKAPVVPSVSAKKAMSGAKLFKATSSRDVTRVLFISRNEELLNPTKQSLDGYVNISDLFDEVHILILRQGISPKKPVLRVNNNVWIYTAASKFWWLTPDVGEEIVENQLEFADGFRPDLIVALDPFESALMAHRLSKKYDRPAQLHILDDFTNEEFIKESPNNYWRNFLPRFTIPMFDSTRTLSNTIENKLQKKYNISDLDTLPRYQNYESLIDLKPTLDLKEKYKPFVFFILYIGKLDHKSTLYRAIDSARFILSNRTVGMIVLGAGKNKKEFEKRAEILGVSEQVIFETKVSDVVPYLKSANMMIVTDTDANSEEIVIKGAAAGIPMIMSRTEVREDIFSDGKSAFLADETDVQTFSVRINDLLNDIGLRRKFVLNGQDVVRDKFHTDPDEYRSAYRASIEQAFFIDSDEEVE